MDSELLIKVGVFVICLVLLGIALTAYEFREHIAKRLKKKRNQSE